MTEAYYTQKQPEFAEQITTHASTLSEQVIQKDVFTLNKVVLYVASFDIENNECVKGCYV